MASFQVLPNTEVIDADDPYTCHHMSDALEIGSEKGPMVRCEVMMLVHRDFEANAAVFRKKIEEFFDTLLANAVH